MPVLAGDEALIESPAWRPRAGARHFVPALSVLTAAECSVRLELSVAAGARWSAWVATASIGADRFEPLPPSDGAVTCDIDVFTSTSVDGVRLRVRVRARDLAAVLAAPWLATLSASDLDPSSAVAAPGAAVPAEAVRIDVAARSQVEEAATLRHRICSPTSVAMVLERWGRAVAPGTLAAEMFHPQLDLYGVWPAAIRAAARHGVAGYLLRFPDWSAAAWCLTAGLPIVASVRYQRGELTGAAIAETAGHLLVLTGYDGEAVLVNDPAAATRAEVRRRYRREELERVWLGRTGVGYVFFDPAVS